MEAYQIIRTAGGIGQDNGPFISIHDGFFSRTQWVDFFPNADRISIDTHPYICFGGQSDAAMSTYSQTPCTTWGAVVNNSMGAFGLTTAGEFSNAVTDCGLWLNGVGLGTRYEGTYVGGPSAVIGNCSTWTDWQSYDAGTKTSITNFALASMDALQVESLLVTHVLVFAHVVPRTISSGRGKLAIRAPQEKLNHLLGLINLVWRTDGCL